MVKHIILWKIKEEFSEKEKQNIKNGVKEGLEGLNGNIPGLENIKVIIDGLESSNADIMLDSEFIDYDSLKRYSIHPMHVKVADEKVIPFMEIRLCMDYCK
jgi:hypothetical protein